LRERRIAAAFAQRHAGIVDHGDRGQVGIAFERAAPRSARSIVVSSARSRRSLPVARAMLWRCAACRRLPRSFHNMIARVAASNSAITAPNTTTWRNGWLMPRGTRIFPASAFAVRAWSRSLSPAPSETAGRTRPAAWFAPRRTHATRLPSSPEVAVDVRSTACSTNAPDGKSRHARSTAIGKARVRVRH